MPTNEVITRTEQLIDYLGQLAEQSNLTKEQLVQLETITKNLKVGDVTNLSDAINLISKFRGELRAVGIDSIGIYNATQYYVQLTRALNLANNEQERFNALAIAKQANINMGKLGTPGYGGKGIGYTPAEQAQYTVLEQQREAALAKARGIYQQAPVISTQYGAEVQQRLQQELDTQTLINAAAEKEALALNSEIQAREKINALFNQELEKAIALKTKQEQQQNAMYGGTGGVAAFRAGITPNPVYSKTEIGTEPEADITKKQGPLTAESLQKLGLSSTAADNLNTKLTALGMTQGRVVTSTKELSTGIQTVSFAFEKEGQMTQTYSAHLDKAGTILDDTQRRFRSFGSAVMRDVVEVLKWTIAIGAIYGPMRKLGELLTEAKQIQLAVVDVQIVLGNSTEKMNIAFEASARVATETSSTLLGVIQGYSLAAGAAASAGNDFERLAATESLLKNSMILSKLAGTDQKASLDTLVGALSQAGMKLTEGTRLLDSWVAVSKKSNVSVNQMATTFAIVGSAAQEVGLSFDQLNGLVGAMGQATNLSADEIGNAIRGIIAAMQTDKASAEFAKYGIATKTLNGDMRDLMEVFREIKVMQQTGLLDDKAMGALMEAGGAGARRGAQLSALVKNLSLVMDLTTVSQNANGDAAKAMALEMETLDAATTRLNNAFTELAKTLGTEGGILDFLTAATKGATGLVKGIRELVGVMKWAAPVFATFLLAKGISGTATGINLLGNALPKVMQSMLATQALGGLDIAPLKTQSLIEKVAGKPSTSAIEPVTYGALFGGIGKKLMQPMFPQEQAISQMGTLGIGTKVATSVSGVFSKMNWASILGPAMIAATNIGKPMEEGIPRAITGALGSIPGILMGNPIWATIGSIIATGFYDKFLTLKGDIGAGIAQWISENPQKAPTAEEAAKPQTWADTLMAGIKSTLEGAPPAPLAPPTTQPTLDELLSKMDKDLVGMMSSNEKIGVNLNKYAPMTKEQKAAGFGDIKGNEGMLILSMYLAQLSGKTLTGQKIGEVNPLSGLTQAPYFTQETMDKIKEYLNTFMVKQAQQGFTSTTFETGKTAEIQALSGLVSTASADLMEKAIKDIAAGATSGIANLNNAQQIVNTLATSAGTLIEAQQQTPGMPTIKGPEAINVLTNLTPDEADKLNTAVSDIGNGLSALEVNQANIDAERAKGVQVDQKYLDIETSLNEQIANGRQQLMQLYPALKQVALARQAEAMMKPTVEVPEGITADQLQKAVTEGERMWDAYLESQNIPPDMLEAWKAQQEDQILMAKDEVFSITTKVPSKFLNLSLEKLGLNQPPGITEYPDVTKAQFGQMKTQYPIVKDLLAQLGFVANEQNTIVQLKDGFSLEHFDNTIMQLLMKDLIDETKKQGLQGIYNLPEGATFMVPVTAYEMSKATVTEMAGGGGGLEGIADLIAMLKAAIEAAHLQTTPTYTNLGTTSTSPTVAPGPDDIARMQATGNYLWPPKTTTATTAAPEVWSTGNPLPVMVTNMAEGFKEDILGKRPYDERGAAVQEAIPPATQKIIPPVVQEVIPPVINPPTDLDKQMAPFLGSNKAATPPAEALSPIERFLQNLYNFFDKFPKFPWAEPATTTSTPVPPAASAVPTVIAELPQSMLTWFSQQAMLATPTSALNTNQVTTQAAPVTTALNLSVDSSIKLLVDGRTLATIIKPYLYEDLLRFGSGTTSSTSRSVIA